MNSVPRTGGFGDSITQRFLEDIVPRYCDKVASADETVQLTYDELAQACLHLAHRLDAIAPPGRPVGLLIPNGALFPVATLACLVAGRPYVPIDPSYPAIHIESVLRDAGVGALITERPYTAAAADLPPLPTTDVTTALRPARRRSLETFPSQEPAAILYTSGSTGRPKGVCYDQKAILERVENTTQEMQAGPQDRFALLSSPTTIAALYLPFTALLNGATLYFADARRLGINKVIQTFREAGVTATFAVPVLLRELLSAPGAKEAFRHFRALRTGGDVIVARDLGLWRSILPPTCRVWISLTSTEMPTTFQWIVPPDWEPDGARVPVGYARPEVQLLIVDENGALVPDGEVGELVVKSPYLALGYWQEGQLKPFATDPHDPSVRIFHTGDLVKLREDRLAEMVGRKDRQVKVRGFRVNLGEVEGALRNCAGVAAAAVIPRSQGEEVDALIAYVERKKSEHVGTPEIKAALAKQLPRHMRPSRIHFLDAIPLLPGFKVDVNALLKIDQRHSAATAGSDDGDCTSNESSPVQKATLHLTDADAHRVQLAVKQAWTTVLDQRSFEANAPFDDAGGDSLAALHLWSLIESALKAELSFDNLHLDMTPRALAEAIESQLIEKEQRSGQASDKPLLFYMPTAEGDTFLQAQLRAGISADVRCEIVRYPSAPDFLRDGASFEVLVEAVVRQILEKTDQPCNIIGYSFGGFVAWATACRLKALGRPLGMIGLIDARRSSDVPDQQRLRRFLSEPVASLLRAGLRLTIQTGSGSFLRKLHSAAGRLPAGAAFRANMYFTEQLRICAGRQWTPAVLDHPVCLFRSNEIPYRPDFGWRKLCPRLEILPVGGTHDSLLYPPDRDALCRRIVQKVKSPPNPEMEGSHGDHGYPIVEDATVRTPAPGSYPATPLSGARI